MKATNLTKRYGDGMTFFLALEGSEIPANSTHGYLALFGPDTALNATKDHQIVVVEFDSNWNSWDPSDDHIEIDINSIRSVDSKQWNSSIKDGRMANAWVNYNSTTKNLSVYLTYTENPVYDSGSSLSYIVELREVLPEFVAVELTMVLVGMMGYLAPECVTTGRASKELDVYSFGRWVIFIVLFSTKLLNSIHVAPSPAAP
ncbi:unnamed protein product [Linum tenue]|uniref:Legume lectin domain-containing protein n=1 Tax=Linum tenue TaxID=586396 RepID=A0AAV0S1H1_9ROSI|nr:unnamed protein product [Linum tenue]